MSKRGNGEGTIFFNERLNRWVGQYTLYRQPNGKLKRKTVYGKTRREVRDKINDAMAAIKTNTYIEPSKTTIPEILANQADIKLATNQIKEVSYVRTMDTIKIIKKLEISNMKIQDVTITTINKSLEDIVDYSDSTIGKICGQLSSAFDIAIVNKIVTTNPFKIRGAIIRPKSKKGTKKIDALTFDEQVAFIKELDKNYDKYTYVFYILVFTGLRVGEALALNLSDIDFKNKVIHVNKTLSKDKSGKVILGRTTKTYAGQRDVPIVDELFTILSNMPIPIDANTLLFSNYGKIINPSTINSHMKRICKNAGIRVTKIKDCHKKKNGENKTLKTSKVNTHMLRHTFATRCIEAGMQAVVLSKILGHKDIETTLNIYTSVFERFTNNEVNKINTYFSALS